MVAFFYAFHFPSNHYNYFPKEKREKKKADFLGGRGMADKEERNK